VESLICQAIRERHHMEFVYDDAVRVVEPYVYGDNKLGHHVLRAYQVDGGSAKSGEPIGWKVFSASKVMQARVIDRPFVPRPEYNPEDKHIPRIICRV
jgi:hypothetical protein